MILKIILVIVFVKILVDSLYTIEGYVDLDVKPMTVIPSTIKAEDKEKDCNINIVFPNPEFENTPSGRRLVGYNNDKNSLYYGYMNIIRSANPNDCKPPVI
jgi:hypothetical protein